MAINLLDSIFGGLLSGVIVNSWAFGLICVWSYQYFGTFPNDRRGTKLLVLWMLFIQTFNAILVSKTIYHYVINSFGNDAALNYTTWEFALFHGLSAIAAYSAQLYNARRIFVMTKLYLPVIAIITLATTSLGFALAFTAEISIIGIIDRLHSISWVPIVWLCTSVVCDLLITVFQVVYLQKHRTGIEKTNRIINILILYIMSTGLLTSVTVVAELITFAVFGWNYVHVFLSVSLGAVYTISFLANLDARRRIREIGSGIHTFTTTTSMVRGGDHDDDNAPGISIEIKHTRQVVSDAFSDCEHGEVIKLDSKHSALSSKTNVNGSDDGVGPP